MQTDGTCSVPTCTPPQVLDSSTNTCVDNSPTLCGETGQFYDDSTKACVAQCSTGYLGTGNECIKMADFSCSVTDPTYVGTVYDDNGNPVHMCSDQEQQCKASGGSYGVGPTGQGTVGFVCVPKDHQVPTCARNSVIYIDNSSIAGGGTGFACITADGNNTQLDKNGKPVAKPDPNAGKTADQIASENQQNNQHSNTALKGLSDAMAGTNSKLASLNKSASQTNTQLGTLHQDLTAGLGTANQTLAKIHDNTQAMADTMKAPDSGWLATAPDFSATLGTFMDSVKGAPLLAPLNVPDVSGTCPVISFDLTALKLGVVSSNYFCTFYQNWGAYISSFFIGLYALAGFRVIASA
ncbi:hypothetical protein [Mangrovitalea sediminis]|uniref:hypothetical protein n=1 Tax=Mangrovitalea sediminis TaxID=1982043 RepID=UPI0011776BFD|nr:hypothetical protein [Mangrovitalea sediminis]